jgi:hypothetical protein
MPKPYPAEFRRDVVAIARKRGKSLHKVLIELALVPAVRIR